MNVARNAQPAVWGQTPNATDRSRPMNAGDDVGLWPHGQTTISVTPSTKRTDFAEQVDMPGATTKQELRAVTMKEYDKLHNLGPSHYRSAAKYIRARLKTAV